MMLRPYKYIEVLRSALLDEHREVLRLRQQVRVIQRGYQAALADAHELREQLAP